MKKLILTTVLIFTLSIGYSQTISSQGSCGPNATYILYTDGSLVISGTGEIGTTFHMCPFPGRIMDSIKYVTIEEGINVVGPKAFNFGDSTNIETVTFHNSVTKIGFEAFKNNAKRVNTHNQHNKGTEVPLFAALQ